MLQDKSAAEGYALHLLLAINQLNAASSWLSLQRRQSLKGPTFASDQSLEQFKEHVAAAVAELKHIIEAPEAESAAAKAVS